jgi:outer membrane protein OmpA-like peptidoglycan-associated protein
VQWVQAALNGALGLRLPPTGVTDVATRSAIRSFQQRTGLAVDGIVGPITQAALLQAGAPPLPGTSAASSTAVRGGAAGTSTAYARGGGAGGGAAANPCAGLKPKEVLDRFGFDVAAVPPAHQPRLVGIAGCIIASHRRGRPIKAVKIVGHTDREGTEAYNLQLGQRRAEEVKRQFVETLERMQKGTAARIAITAESRGEAELVSTKEGALNRRVEIHVARPLRPPPPKPRPQPKKEVPAELQELLRKVQKILKLLPPGLGGIKSPTGLRFLDANEQRVARGVYHGSLDFSRILISDGLGGQGRPFTVATQIPGGWYVVMNMGDLGSWAGPPLAPSTLIHELAHAWQSQHHGTDPQAFMKNSVACQLGAMALEKTLGITVSAYAYIPGKPFGDYAAEQIAQQVEHTFTGGGAPTPTIIGVIRSVAPNAPSADNKASLGVMTGFHVCMPGVIC